MKRKKIKRSKKTGDEPKRKKPQSQSKVDRLSSLPDSLLVSILTLLRVEKAAATSVLSHRWQHLWTQITRLKLSHYMLSRRRINDFKRFRHYYEARPNTISFVSTVNNIFQQLTSSKIHTFDLDFPPDIKDDTQLLLCDSALDTWARRICTHNVEEIRVSRTRYCNEYFVLLPTCVFQCQSLVVLQVEDDGFRIKLPDNGIVNLPNLKKLKLSRISNWDSETMSTLFKSCVVLEELDLRLWALNEPLSIDISCPNLRSLSISLGYVKRKGSKYVINAPRLEVIHIEDHIPSYFHLLETPFSLIKAKIKLDSHGGGGEYDHGQLSEVIHWICYAKSLELSSTVLYPLVHLDVGALPRYNNLGQLRIHLNDSGGGDNLLRCLKSAPNLEILVIEISYGYKGAKWNLPDIVPACLTSKLQKIEVKNFEGNEGELEILMYFLKHAKALKLLLVGVLSHSTIQMRQETLFCSNLIVCPRISMACVIQFNGSYIQASSENNLSLSALSSNSKLALSYASEIEFATFGVLLYI